MSVLSRPVRLLLVCINGRRDGLSSAAAGNVMHLVIVLLLCSGLSGLRFPELRRCGAHFQYEVAAGHYVVVFYKRCL